MTDSSDAIHRAIESLKTLDKQDRLSFFARAKVLRALKDLRPHKIGYNNANKLADFWVSIGLKPSTAENYIRVLNRFGEICEKEGLDVVPTRLQKCLGLKKGPLEAELDLLSLCTPDVPYSDLLSVIAQAKGKPEVCCNHSGEYEVWHKCKACGHWAEF